MSVLRYPTTPKSQHTALDCTIILWPAGSICSPGLTVAHNQHNDYSVKLGGFAQPEPHRWLWALRTIAMPSNIQNPWTIKSTLEKDEPMLWGSCACTAGQQCRIVLARDD